MSVEQWEQYYRAGALATGPVGADGSYDLEVRTLWQDFFTALPKSSRLLDVATGNGVVASIALATSRDQALDLEIHGSDLARIQPLIDVHDSAERLQGIHFHPGVATQALPMEDATFNAVCGQYALEYSPIQPALSEIFRVLKPGGMVLFVVHHNDSVLIRNAKNSLREGHIVLSECNLYRCLHALLSLENATPELAQSFAAPLQKSIRNVKTAYAEAFQVGSGQIAQIALDATQTLLKLHGQMPPAVLGREVDRAERELQEAIQRVRDLIEVAQDAEGMARIQEIAVTLGFSDPEVSLVHHAVSNVVGWKFIISKPSDG